ncbi:SSI family serine proteinase inhibitor [Streptomyces caniferus]|uniref:SSI family serine proteinase inhibitor n=1 Tax=Streptomyces caniferus TaxID=285557 RepID=UPI0037F10DEE
MPHRRTSSLFASAAGVAGAATTTVTRLAAGTATAAMTRLAAGTAAAGRVSLTAAVSVVSVTAALALAAPAASAAPIPLPHRWSGGGIIGAGHHALAGPHDLAEHGRPGAHGTPTEHGVPLAHGIAPEHGGTAGHRTPADHSRPVSHGTPADHSEPVGHGTPADRRAPSARHDTPAGHGAPARHHARTHRHAPADHLTVTVHRSGSAATNGTFELYCHPGGGNHRNIKGACAKLDGMTKWGKDPFAPVPQGVNCTMMYGGPAIAHVTGTWAGRPVNADFRRTNGCEISRWSRFEPLLPSTSS